MLTEEVDGQWLSVTDLARAKNVSKQAISKRLKRLADVVEIRKAGAETLVNVEQYDRATAANTDPAQALRKPEPEESTAQSGFTAERARREGYQAENARLDLEQRLGHLTDVATVERHQMKVFRTLRDRLLGLPATLADRLAAAPDARAVRVLLDQELRRLLEALATDLDKLSGEDEADAA